MLTVQIMYLARRSCTTRITQAKLRIPAIMANHFRAFYSSLRLRIACFPFTSATFECINMERSGDLPTILQLFPSHQHIRRRDRAVTISVSHLAFSRPRAPSDRSCCDSTRIPCTLLTHSTLYSRTRASRRDTLRSRTAPRHVSLTHDSHLTMRRSLL